MSGLFPIYTVQWAVTVSPPASVAPYDLIEAVRAELARQGNRARTAGPGRIEFEGPGLLGAMGTFSVRRRAATMIRGGSVTFDPSHPARMQLELRYSWTVWGWPVLMACIVVLQEMDAGMRLGALVLLGGFVLFQVNAAREAYESWIADGARRAGVR
ncbi:MAG: hypothetical protein JO306_14470 [Gemmatimonadetes bacterium]|nr:hypothetical protein [Gemmatimonadota bacterium]